MDFESTKEHLKKGATRFAQKVLNDGMIERDRDRG